MIRVDVDLEETTALVIRDEFAVDVVVDLPGVEIGVPGPPGPPGADSTVPGPPGADSTVPGPPGADSTVPGPPGADAQWVSMTQAEYDALPVKDPNTLYVIVG